MARGENVDQLDIYLWVCYNAGVSSHPSAKWQPVLHRRINPSEMYQYQYRSWSHPLKAGRERPLTDPIVSNENKLYRAGKKYN